MPEDKQRKAERGMGHGHNGVEATDDREEPDHEIAVLREKVAELDADVEELRRTVAAAARLLMSVSRVRLDDVEPVVSPTP